MCQAKFLMFKVKMGFPEHGSISSKEKRKKKKPTSFCNYH